MCTSHYPKRNTKVMKQIQELGIHPSSQSGTPIFPKIPELHPEKPVSNTKMQQKWNMGEGSRQGTTKKVTSFSNHPG